MIGDLILIRKEFGWRRERNPIYMCMSGITVKFPYKPTWAFLNLTGTKRNAGDCKFNRLDFIGDGRSNFDSALIGVFLVPVLAYIPDRFFLGSRNYIRSDVPG